MEVLFTLRKNHAVATVVLAVVCAVIVGVDRAHDVPVTVMVGGIKFSYTDFFVIVAAGIGGLGCGMLTFTFLFINEIVMMKSDFSLLYAMCTYMVLLLIASRLSHRRWFASVRRMLASALVLSVAAAACWYVTFVFFQQEVFYSQYPVWKLVASALPEMFLASGAIWAFMHFAPDSIKLCFEVGWLYTQKFCGVHACRRRSVLAERTTIMALAEAVVLCILAIIFFDIQMSVELDGHFSWKVFTILYRINLQMAMIFLSAALPIAYLLNVLIQHLLVIPINAMSFMMERYFDTDEANRIKKLPDLPVHSGDEVEKLYHSLQKMTGDISCYVNKLVEQERKTAHLTHEFMLALAKTVDAKDHYTSGHSVRVARYAQEIARRMGKSAQEQDDIFLMGILHDIGKIGVSEAIINKNGRLTDEEFAQIKEHPMMGYNILRNVTELPALATGARWHHERYDGHGYPDGLSGTDIPEEARIIAVADCYDAMTSKRAYSDIRPQETVRAEIIRCRGTQFDPAIADIMVAMIDDDHDYTMREGGNDPAEQAGQAAG